MLGRQFQDRKVTAMISDGLEALEELFTRASAAEREVKRTRWGKRNHGMVSWAWDPLLGRSGG